MKIKICGLFDSENIREIAQLQPDFMGFIFYPESKRFVGNNFDYHNLKQLPETIRKVAVFVNATIAEIDKIQTRFQFDYLQLHGDEPVAFCRELHQKKYKIIKAFAIDKSFNFNVLPSYEPYCDYFLFDTKTDGYGGSGKIFDWQLLKKYTLKTPLFISGGLGIDNYKALVELDLPQLAVLDFNSKLENEKHIKDIINAGQLITQIKNL